jgi:predicted phage terminase large subunit-like protein
VIDPAQLERAADLRQFYGKCLADDFTRFVKKAWPVLHPETPMTWSWHYDYLCELLTLVKRGELTRLIINIPPRTAKSSIVSILYPVWLWTSEPQHDFLIASHSLDLSVEHSVQRRRVLKSRWFQRHWGHKFQLAPDRNQIAQFTNTCQGSMIAVSLSANVLGRGGDTLILDDPLTAPQALSETQRKTANTWFDNTFSTRLNNPATGAIVIVMQRLHELDVTGYLLDAQPDRWKHVRIPLVAEEEETYKLPISGSEVRRNPGDVLMPERFTPRVVEEQRSRRLEYAAQYQQRPAPLEGNIIRRHEIRFYGGIDPTTGVRDEDLPTTFDRKIISVDCAFKDTATADYTAIGVIGVKGRKRYILEMVNKRLDIAATETEILSQRWRHGYISAILVEDRANGQAVVQRLQAHVPGVIAVNPQGGKAARMHAMAPEWQAGDWYVHRNAPWAGDFIKQITIFPAARHDDMCDVVSQAAAWLGQIPLHDTYICDAFTGESR